MIEGYVDIRGEGWGGNITGDSGTAFIDTWGGLIEGVRI